MLDDDNLTSRQREGIAGLLAHTVQADALDGISHDVSNPTEVAPNE